MNIPLIEKLERNNNIKAFLDLLEDELDLECELAIKKIFYKWKTLSDPEFAFIGHDYENRIQVDFEKYALKFDDCPLFQFYIGILIWIEPWTFIPNYNDNIDYNNRLGSNMIKKSSLLSPESKLFLLYNTDSKRLKSKLIDDILYNNDFPIKGGEIQSYFYRVLLSMRKNLG